MKQFTGLRPGIDYDNFEAWMARRLEPGNVTASESAAVLGENDYQSAVELWMDRRAGTKKESTFAMNMGAHAEPVMAEEFERQTGIPIVNPGKYRIWAHGDYPNITATPDFLTPLGGNYGPLELKYSQSHHDWKHAWGQGIAPSRVNCQIQIQMACMGAKHGTIFCVGPQYKTAIIDVSINPEFVSLALEAMGDFSRKLLSGEMPEIDGSESTTRAIKALYPESNGETIQLPRKAIDWHDRIGVLNGAQNILKDESDMLKNRLRKAIGDNAYGVGEGFRYSNKSQIRKGKITLETDQAQALDDSGFEYKVTQPSEFRTLRSLKA